MDGYALGYRPLSPTVRRGLKGCVGCGLSLAILLTASVCCAATYRWTDERGKVHYGDSIPPQYAGRGHTELNAQGRVIRQVEPAQTSAEGLARKERQEAALRQARDRQRRDNALLATYGNAREIDLAKQRAMAQEQSLLASLQSLRKHSTSKMEIDQIDGMILQRYKAMEDIRTKYDAEKARYLELTGGHR